jgi:hypothetical protein
MKITRAIQTTDRIPVHSPRFPFTSPVVADDNRLEVEVSGKNNRRREWLEAVERVEQRKRTEEAKEEKRLRRELAKVGLTLEEFEEGCQEFARKFQGGYR